MRSQYTTYEYTAPATKRQITRVNNSAFARLDLGIEDWRGIRTGGVSMTQSEIRELHRVLTECLEDWEKEI